MNTNLFLIFTTGLLTGGLTCIAVQGGLLATMIAENQEENQRDKTRSEALPIAVFLLAKLIGYTVLGFLLGWFGSVFQLSLSARLVLQFAVIVFMLGNALNLMNVHPVFRYFVVKPPKFLTRMVRQQSKSKHLFGPAMLGLFTVFIPCGTTQAMMALAIGTSNPFFGAAIMFAFILGTSPVFFVLGYFASKIGEAMQAKFLKFAAAVIIFLALYSLNGALALAGAPIDFGSLVPKSSTVKTESLSDLAPPKIDQNPTVHITGNGYEPSVLYVKAGEPVTIKLVNDGGYSCVQAFTIPSLGLQKIVSPGGSDTLTFTPKTAGQIPFMCSMGMYRGMISVQN